MTVIERNGITTLNEKPFKSSIFFIFFFLQYVAGSAQRSLPTHSFIRPWEKKVSSVVQMAVCHRPPARLDCRPVFPLPAESKENAERLKIFTLLTAPTHLPNAVNHSFTSGAFRK